MVVDVLDQHLRAQMACSYIPSDLSGTSSAYGQRYSDRQVYNARENNLLTKKQKKKNLTGSR